MPTVTDEVEQGVVAEKLLCRRFRIAWHQVVAFFSSFMVDQTQRVLVVYRYRENTADGGSAYERMVLDALSESCAVDAHAIVLGGTKLGTYLRMPLEAARFRNLMASPSRYKTVIETMDASLIPVKRAQRQIVIVHHIGSSRDRVYAVFEEALIRRLKASDCIVTVSKYWQSRLVNLGFRNVRLIYNGFPIQDFNFEDGEIDRFLRCYELLGKPIVYIGNHGRYKGTRQVAECLLGMDVHIVASGDAQSQVSGVRTLRLYRRDYLRLLRASSLAITMSQFDEGWCRTAHEAMLCGTPVVGSGRGGMRELLEGGGQVICEKFGEFRSQVEAILGDPLMQRSLGRTGQMFARRFSVERLRRDWVDLVTCRHPQTRRA